MRSLLLASLSSFVVLAAGCTGESAIEPQRTGSSEAALVASGGTWTPRVLAPAGSSDRLDYDCLGGPAYAESPTGAALYVWIENDVAGGTCLLRGASRAGRASAWSAPETIASLGASGANGNSRVLVTPKIALDASGGALVTYGRQVGIAPASVDVLVASRPSGAAAWIEEHVHRAVPAEGAFPNTDDFVQIAGSPSGAAITVWRSFQSSDGKVVTRASHRTLPGVWSAPEILDTEALDFYVATSRVDGSPRALPLPQGFVIGSPNYYVFGNDGSRQVAFDARGNAIAVWRRDGAVRYATRAAAATSWTAPATVMSDVLFDRSPLRVAVSPTTGEAVLAYSQAEIFGLYTISRVKAVTWNPSTRSWGLPTTLSPSPIWTLQAHHAIEPEVAFSPDGDAVVAFERVTYQDTGGVDTQVAVKKAGDWLGWRGTEVLPHGSVSTVIAEPGGGAIVGIDVVSSGAVRNWTYYERTR
jgi:hypothetical protein